MGKKKQRQNSNCVVNFDQSESSDAAIFTNLANKAVCPHLNKAVDANSLRKNFRGNGHLSNRECSECKKENVSSGSEDIWLCLRCGCSSCGPDKKNHSLIHFETPRSDSHSLALKLETLTVWCYECRLEITTQSSQKLHSCVDFIKQQRDKLVMPAGKKANNAGITSPIVSSTNGETKNGSQKTNNANKFSKSESTCQVKGLTNVGNTCFFNSVLQCLAQTPGLTDVLKRMQEPGQKFEMSLDDGEILGGELEKGGPLSESLLELLNDMKSRDGNTLLVPRKVLANLRKKCPQFEGGDQHDAHELLRQLLDIVHVEDLKRYQLLVLQVSGLNRKVNPESVDSDKRKKVNYLCNKIKDNVSMALDQIFKGVLVSQLQCQTCLHTSNCLESFLDLSLPVTTEKPMPPVARRKWNYNKNEDVDDNDQNVPAQPTKQQKRKLVRRGRNKKNNQHKENGQGEPSITEEDKRESSDADIEDNDEVGADCRKLDISESGYSSEKLASSRTSPTTESQGDAEDSACASPASVPYLTAITQAMAGLQFNEPGGQPLNEQETLREPESSFDYSAVSVQECNNSMFGLNDPTHSMDSSDSLKCNYSCNSDARTLDEFNGMVISDVSVASQDVSLSEQDDPQNFQQYQALGETDLNKTIKSNVVSVPNSVDELQTDKSDSTVTEYFSKLDKSIGCDNDVIDSELVEVNNTDSQISNKVCQTKKRRLKYRITRGSPVEMENNQILDGDLLIKSLENYKSENLYESKNNDNVDMISEVPIENGLIGSTENSQEVSSSLLSNESGGMGFVLVNGVSNNDDCDIYKTVDTKILLSKLKEDYLSREKERSLKKREINEDNKLKNTNSKQSENKGVECSETQDSLRNGHKSLAPRNQCSEGECSVLSCLNHFTAIELMTGNNLVGCEACTRQQHTGPKDKEAKTVYRASTKRLLIHSPPPVLILHLKRFQVQRYSVRKLSCHVQFPSILDLAPFCSHSVQKQLQPGQSEILYSLFGVVAHSGTLHGGHYYAYVKVRSEDKRSENDDPAPGTWYYISDSHTRVVSEDVVFSSQAYLLFYERLL